MPRRPNEARREQLLDELERIFRTEGFLHLRVGTLAGRLHCSRSTLYELAGSKEQLFARVVERFADRAVTEAAAYAEAAESPRERVLRFFSVIAEYQARTSAQFWRDAYGFGPTAARFAESRAWGVVRVKAYLDEGIAAAVLRPANTAFIAHVIWLAAAASRDPDVLERTGISTRDAMQELGALIVNGMMVQERDVGSSGGGQATG